jgi:hypothetical protein
VVVVLRDGVGREVARDERTLPAGGSTAVTRAFPDGVRASGLELTFRSIDGRPTRTVLHDLRVQGQSPELAAYVAQLPFPAIDARR